jgi:hypothetical protein
MQQVLAELPIEDHYWDRIIGKRELTAFFPFVSVWAGSKLSYNNYSVGGTVGMARTATTPARAVKRSSATGGVSSHLIQPFQERNHFC